MSIKHKMLCVCFGFVNPDLLHKNKNGMGKMGRGWIRERGIGLYGLNALLLYFCERDCAPSPVNDAITEKSFQEIGFHIFINLVIEDHERQESIVNVSLSVRQHFPLMRLLK